MEVAYKKDLRHNYMIITEDENTDTESFCIKMIEYQTVKGLLLMEQRRMDYSTMFYYDITGKQSLNTILEKSALSYDRVKKIIVGILDTIDKAYECLLMEDDFILLPEYIYLEITSNTPYLCYYSGYHKNIFSQVNSLLEYMMNKVDYNDKDAVLLVYQLYAVSKEDGFSFEHLMQVLKKQAEDLQPYNKLMHQSDRNETELTLPNIKNKNTGKGTGDNKTSEEYKPLTAKKSATDLPVNKGNRALPAELIHKEKLIPVMKEKLEDEEEISCYPWKNYLFSGVCILIGIIIIILGFSTKLVYNTFGDRIDYSKLFAIFLIVFCIEGYLLNKIWDKNNMITKMVDRKRYVDPRNEYITTSNLTLGRESSLHQPIVLSSENSTSESVSNNIKPSKLKNEERKNSKMGKVDFQENELEEVNPTCLLNSGAEDVSVTLHPVDEVNYKPIKIKDFPFFIGKLKKNVDYCLEKDVVSRFHAKISKEQDKFFITDLNSMNGTFVNQHPVLTYEKREIHIGDEIALADIKYTLS